MGEKSTEAAYVDYVAARLPALHRAAFLLPIPVLWRDGRAEVVPDATGVVTDVTSDGIVVGYAVVDEHNAVGWIVRGGKATNLALPPGYHYASPMAVNAGGTVAGAVSTGEPNGIAPAVWSPDGTVHVLPVPVAVVAAGPGEPSAVRDIAEDGTMVGEAHGVPMMWAPDGTPHALPPPPNTAGGTAMGIAGHYAYGTSGNAAVRWDLRTGQVVLMRMEGVVSVRAGTASGLALINSNGSGRTVLQAEDGSSIELYGPDREFASAVAVSADGSAIAGTFVVTDKNHPVVWHCG